MATILRYVRQADLLLLSAASILDLVLWLWWRSSFEIDIRYPVNATILLVINTIIVIGIRSRWYLAALVFAGSTLFWNVAMLTLFYHLIMGR